MDEFETLLKTEDPLERARMAASRIHEHRVAMSRLATIRAQALLELQRQGHTVVDVARILGITRQQVHRLLREARGRGQLSEQGAP